MSAADLARRAFAVGWATSTATHPVPLTERAKRACAAAMLVAEASPQPAASATLQLGELEGIWAIIYARREAIEKLHGAALTDVLDAIKQLDWSQVVDRIGTYLLTDPGMPAKELAALIARDVENLISGQLPYDANQAWRAVTTAALTDATAEGQAAALALIGDAANIQIDWNLAATAAKDALAGNQGIWDLSSTWIERQLHGIGYQVSQTLAGMWADGATAAEMEAAVMDLLNTGRSIAGVLLDTAVGTALSAGALNTYSLAGVQYADFLTAGDGRVCAACAYAEDNNSYPLYDCPQPPLHIGCRCTVSPSAYQPTTAGLQLVSSYQDTTYTDMQGDAAA